MKKGTGASRARKAPGRLFTVVKQVSGYEDTCDICRKKCRKYVMHMATLNNICVPCLRRISITLGEEVGIR